MMTRRRTAFVMAGVALVLGGACSSTKPTAVTSNTGPTPHSTTTTAAPPTSTATTTAAPTTTTVAAAPSNPPSLYLGSPLNVPPGTPGQLGVVMNGQQTDSGTVPVVVRNNTSDALASLDVTGTARSGGTLVGSGDSQGLVPAIVKPGEWAFGYVYFQSKVPAGSTFEFTVSGSKLSDLFQTPVDLQIPEVNMTQGAIGPSLVGIVKNPSSSAVEYPVSVDVLCFQGTTLLSAQNGFTSGNAPVAAGGTGSFSVDLLGSCPSWVAGSYGTASS